MSVQSTRKARMGMADGMTPGIERATQRVELASRCLGGAADDLHAARSRGLNVNGTPATLEAEAARVGELAEHVAKLKWFAPASRRS
jgi:hypothetical protein